MSLYNSLQEYCQRYISGSIWAILGKKYKKHFYWKEIEFYVYTRNGKFLMALDIAKFFYCWDNFSGLTLKLAFFYFLKIGKVENSNNLFWSTE